MNFSSVIVKTKNQIESLFRRADFSNSVISILFAIFMFMSCGIVARTQSILGIDSKLYVDVRDNINDDSPVALDLVIVKNEDLLKILLNMTAKEWFGKREQIKRDFMEGIEMNCLSWEWVPEREILLYAIPVVPKAKAIVIFANYFSPGEHRLRVDPFSDVKITLLENEFTAESAKLMDLDIPKRKFPK